jgi:hypothetical protein
MHAEAERERQIVHSHDLIDQLEESHVANLGGSRDMRTTRSILTNFSYKSTAPNMGRQSCGIDVMFPVRCC